MKTVLAPNAPWPKIEPLPERKPKKRSVPKKPTQADMRFDEWLKREKAKDEQANVRMRNRPKNDSRGNKSRQALPSL